jgi:2-oxoglutarate dehydrogenase complex dehydrogenase (E1) component-like enzyme
MDKFSYISNADVAAIDNIYQQYLADTESVDFGWQKFFEGFEMGQQKFNGKSVGTGSAELSEDILKEMEKSTRSTISPFSITTISLLGMILLSTVYSILVTVIFRKVLLRGLR